MDLSSEDILCAMVSPLNVSGVKLYFDSETVFDLGFKLHSHSTGDPFLFKIFYKVITRTTPLACFVMKPNIFYCGHFYRLVYPFVAVSFSSDE